MESIKISLADAAQKRGDSVDYLLALAEVEQLDVFARLQPFTAKLGMYPHKTDIYDNQTRSTATHEYTALLPAQIQALREGRQIEIKVVRPEGFENGYSIPSLSKELLLYWLDNPQQIGIESIFLNWRDEPKQTDSISKETPPQTVPAPTSQNGISTSQVITAFESITNNCKLKKALANKPKWIAYACLDRGLRGKRQGTWNPVILAIALLDKRYSQKPKLTNAFYEHKFLSDWRDEWKEKSDY